MSSLLIVDDHMLMRESLRSLLNGVPNITVCAEAKDGEEAIEKVRELHPDIVLLDINMPRMNGIQAAQEIHRLGTSTKIVFLTIHPTSLFYENAFGAQGLVSKIMVEAELLPAISRLVEENSGGVNHSSKYPWQLSVIEALASPAETLEKKVTAARQAIAIRLIDLKPIPREEREALDEALRELNETAHCHQVA